MLSQRVRPLSHPFSLGWTDNFQNTQLHSGGVTEYHFLNRIWGHIFFLALSYCCDDGICFEYTYARRLWIYFVDRDLRHGVD